MRYSLLALLAMAAVQDEPASPAQKVHYRVSRNFNKPDNVDSETLIAARKSSIFGARYAAAILQAHKAFDAGAGFEEAWRGLMSVSPQGGPAGAAEHLKALAAVLKQEVYCRDCQNGRVTCARCKGTKYSDVDCATCNGTGRFRRTGDGVGSDMMCPKCNGKKIFTNCLCPDCSATGTTKCESCRGRPWFDKCLVKSCEGGQRLCDTCGGDCLLLVDCATCSGEGRLPTKNAGFTIRCDKCDQTGKRLAHCKACGKSGRVACEGCAATGKGTKKGIEFDAIFSVEPCDACSGSGWPEAGKACGKCVGLGVRLKPGGAVDHVLD